MKASHLLSVLALLCFALLALPARSEELTEEELAPELPASLDEEALEEGNHEERSSCYVPGVGSGTCQYNYYSCAGTYRAGYCPGASNYQCCVRPTTTSSSSSSSSSGSVSCTVPGVGTGRCQATSTYCAGSYRAGYCPGASNVQCCVTSSTASTSGSSSGGEVAPGGRTLSKCEVVNAFRRAGFSGADLARLVCTAYYESRWNTNAINKRNGDGSWDWGILQVNDRWWCRSANGRGTGCNTECRNLTGANGAYTSALCAKQVIREQGWNAWVAYKNNKSTCDNYSIAGC